MMNKNTSKNIFKATITLIVSCALIMPASIAVLHVKENVMNSGDNYRKTGTIIYVDDDNTEGPWDGTLEHPYQNISDGVDASSAGDTVFVFNGLYVEQVDINKANISLIGENQENTIIDGDGKRVVLINADWVNISGFTIRSNETAQSSKNGINVDSDYVVIMDNIIMNNQYGIYLRHGEHHSSHIIIKGNTITNNERGFWIPYAEHNNITGNTIIGNTDGIYLGMFMVPYQPHTPTHNIITGNTIANNNKGISLTSPESNNITENTITNNTHGIYVVDFQLCGDQHNKLYVARNTITNNGENAIICTAGGNSFIGNTITNNNNGIYLLGCPAVPYGLLLSNNIVTGNNITDNNNGIYLEQGCHNNTIAGNTITDNNNGIYLFKSKRNTIAENNVTDNGNGTYMHYSNNNTVTGNTITNNNVKGIFLRKSNKNNISKNTLANNNLGGIFIRKSCNNNISKNTITNNTQYGIKLLYLSDNNRIYHNTFINNTEGNAYNDDDCDNNIWNETYPFAGNYWDNHDGYDGYHGPDQDVPGDDGIVDQPGGGLNPYIINEENKDWYPLMEPFVLLANTGGPYIGYLGEPHSFSGSAEGLYPPFNWSWDLGDGNASEEQNPNHIYNLTGTFIVVLNVTDSQGNYENDTTTITIEIGELQVDANGPYYDLVNEEIQFTGSAHYGVKPYSWSWDFGDGNTSDEQNPTHNYTASNVYTVTLTVTDDRGNSSNDTTICDIRNLPPVHNLDKDMYYWWIQEAVDDANTDDMIYVDSCSTYNYENTVINKSITLVGEEKNITIIDGGGNGNVVEITAREVSISGFTIQNSGNNNNDAGLCINSANNIISENNIVDNNKGIRIVCSSNNTITNCNVSSNNNNGIDLCGPSKYNIISDNIITKNNNIGIYLNIGNWFGSLSDNILRRNTVSNNNRGICLKGGPLGGTSNNYIIENTITNNKINGIKLTSSSVQNRIYYNNFIDNIEGNAYADCNNIWDNGYPLGGNYWSDFDEPSEGAYDNNTDGFVDSPYIIPSKNRQDNYPFIVANGWLLNRPPYYPGTPNPANNSVNVDIDIDLSWTGGDPDPYDTITYDVHFGTTSPPGYVDTVDVELYDPGVLDYETTYYWKIVAHDDQGHTTYGPIWEFTTEGSIPDLECDGSLSWTDVKPGDTVEGSFTVENNGDPTSELNWAIDSYPDWGTWTFTPSSGEDLTPEDGEVTVEVTVVAPDEPETEFTGEIKIINTDDPDDYCIIDISLATPVNQHSILSRIIQFLDNFLNHFPMLERILEQLLATLPI